MTPEDKARKAEQLFDLMVRDSFPDLTTAGASGKLLELQKELGNRFRKLHIELRLKHFTDEQLEALLSFYDSDLGKSIIDAELQIREEFSMLMKGVTEELDSEKPDNLSETIDRREDGDGGT